MIITAITNDNIVKAYRYKENLILLLEEELTEILGRYLPMVDYICGLFTPTNTPYRALNNFLITGGPTDDISSIVDDKNFLVQIDLIQGNTIHTEDYGCAVLGVDSIKCYNRQYFIPAIISITPGIITEIEEYINGPSPTK